MPPLGDMKGGVGQNHVIVVVPTLFAGQGVVHADHGLLLMVQEQVDRGQHGHGGGDVVARQVAGQVSPVGGGQPAGPVDVLPGGRQEAAGAAGWVQDGLVLLRVDDVAGCAELSGRRLGAQVLQEHFVGVADFLGVVGVKAVNGPQEVPQNYRVVVGDIGVPVDGANGRHDVGPAQQGHAVPVATVHLVGGLLRAHQGVPATFGAVAGEITGRAAQRDAGGVLGAEELVNQRPRDFLALVHGERHLAHQQVAGSANDMLDFLHFHGFTQPAPPPADARARSPVSAPGVRRGRRCIGSAAGWCR